jgi:hypothetical protein
MELALVTLSLIQGLGFAVDGVFFPGRAESQGPVYCPEPHDRREFMKSPGMAFAYR